MIDSGLLDQLVEDADLDGVAQLVVGAVVEDDGKVLLLKRPADDFMGGIFELPSGKVEAGEDLKSALVREVEEETGLQVAVATAYLGSFDYLSGSGKKSRQFNFVVAVEATEPVVLQEHDEFQWAPIEEELPVTDAVKKVFEAYRELQAN
ncbi:NUDIX domain-containing protein [Lentzea aerocolonigenes]|uniref:NUDIX domain-containing protein n=1 Tax=Lentzea aerocolonigenes TaxID=68170 RepID=UPI0004C3F9E9|nr:NUDIX domain-containing protein [Lentzea aerocolonigenes]MCP2245712.1 8-oxo-dGTP diphosphatase [Lentzea aerocolonigenes]